jgi:hypothetical protein
MGRKHIKHRPGVSTVQFRGNWQDRFLLGPVSMQTTEQYLGCKQQFRSEVNYKIGLESDEGWKGATGSY